jgi:hypothetical protein
VNKKYIEIGHHWDQLRCWIIELLSVFLMLKGFRLDNRDLFKLIGESFECLPQFAETFVDNFSRIRMPLMADSLDRATL